MRVFIIAGEPSGDRLGGALMAGLKELAGEVAFDGIGGPDMKAQGLVSRFPMEDLSVMGLVEILPRFRQLMARIDQTAQAVIEARPDVLITIDSPDFSLRVAKRVKAAMAVRTVHYVAPSVWFWRPGRARKMAKVIDHVLALLPFEPPYMEAEGMECDFVGHPVVAEPQATEAEIAAFRAAFGLDEAPVLLVLPGSRRGEVSRLAPIFGASLGPVLDRHPDLRVVVPAAAPTAALVRAAVAEWPVAAPVVIDPNTRDHATAQAHKRAAFRTARAALAASGTVSLELAAAGTPMAIAYGMNRITWEIISRMARMDTVTLVNMIAGEKVVPECLGPACRPDCIVPKLLDVLEAPEAQKAAMELTMERLGRGGEAPGLRAARAVLSRL